MHIIIIYVCYVRFLHMRQRVPVCIVTCSRQCRLSPGTPVLLPIVLGSVIGVVFLVLFVLVITLILKKIRKNRSTESSADVSDTSRPIDGDWRRTDRMFWQGTGEGMRSLPRVNRVEYARMKANSKAMEPFSTVSVTAVEPTYTYMFQSSGIIANQFCSETGCFVYHLNVLRVQSFKMRIFFRI